MRNQLQPSGPSDNRHRRHVLATPIGAGVLGLLLMALVAVIVLLPGPDASPAFTPGPTCGPGSVAPACPPPDVPPVPSPTDAPLPSFVRPTPTPAPTFTSYVVKGSDTLTSIARAFSTSPRSLAWWNRGTYPSLDPESEGYDPNHIEPGWTLVLIPGVIVDDANAPTPSPGGPTVPPTVAPSPTVEPSATPTSP